MTNLNIDELPIRIVGAREHNLKDLSVSIPRNKISVFTGLSGSGKSTLAFDTIYAEGQRRYIESLSSYARNFLEQLKKPEVQSITGITPAIAIDQKSVNTNPRSTVGTITEIYDFLRLLYAKAGTPICPNHKVELVGQDPELIFNDIQKYLKGKKFYLMAPMAQSKKGEFLAEFHRWAKKGFVKAKVDGEFIELEKAKKLPKTKTHDIDLVVDQILLVESINVRLKESLNLALSLAGGRVVVETLDGMRKSYSTYSSCPICNFSFPSLEPRLFSFNNPRGACQTCHGLGTQDLVEEAEYDEGEGGNRKLKEIKYHYINRPLVNKDGEVNELDDDPPDLADCPNCKGSRLRSEALNVLFAGKNIVELSSLSAQNLNLFFNDLTHSSWKNHVISNKIIEQIRQRLNYLIRVGTGYLSIDRSASTLSGGEAQRIRLASQLGSGLIGVLYILDEPSIGLHPRDHHKLLTVIRELRDQGNTILLVEHDEETIREADYIVDMGPGAGRMGGEIVASGSLSEILKNVKSLTGQYLSRIKTINRPQKVRVGNGKSIKIIGASGNNLKKIDVEIPLGKWTVVTGVSGSGKSTLIFDTLYRALARKIWNSSLKPKAYARLEGLEYIDKVIDINQKPIGRTPRSTPATYVGLFPLIREIFSQLPDARLRGLKPGHFSFNVKGGRCENCMGHGQVKMEMRFLADVYVQCETCKGSRFSKEILEIKFKGYSIGDILSMTIGQALEVFKNHSTIFKKLETMQRVGLDYLSLGQSSVTLSGGEAQRIKLSKELSKKSTGSTLLILDEPTTGLHFEDIRKLVEILNELVDQGNSLLVIEHNLDVIKCADNIIDMGPEGGDDGGFVMGTGDPVSFCRSVKSETSKYLAPLLE